MAPCRAVPTATWVASGAIVLGLAGPAAAADPPLLYVPHDAAAAVHDALGGPTLRQGPARPDARWPGGRVAGKVPGHELAGSGPRRIVTRLRAGWRERGAGGIVAVDEITPARWTAASARALAIAMSRLRGDARRVVFLASPSLVGRVGRVDPRRRLPPTLGRLVDAVSRGRATYLQTYRGDMTPLPAREFATHPARWLARWPSGRRRGELRLLLGPDGGAGQPELWALARSTPAGRALLANGVAAYGLRTPADGLAWAAQYQAFRAAPDSAVGGVDAVVTRPGGLTMARAGTRAVRIRISRPGRAVVSVRPRRGGTVRAIRKLAAPTRGWVLVRLPRDTPPGVYQVRAVLIGDGLRDRAVVGVRISSR